MRIIEIYFLVEGRGGWGVGDCGYYNLFFKWEIVAIKILMMKE